MFVAKISALALLSTLVALGTPQVSAAEKGQALKPAGYELGEKWRV